MLNLLCVRAADVNRLDADILGWSILLGVTRREEWLKSTNMDLNKAARLTSTSFSESTFLLENARRNEEILSQGTCLRSVKARVLIVVLFVVLAVLSITAGIVLGVFLTKDEAKSQPNVRTFSKAAVAAGSEVCSTVGVDILKKGGSAVDAAVASSFCEGVVNLQSTGIGGGGFMIYYNATDQSSVMIDFREVAASNITEEMMEIYKNDKDSTVKGYIVASYLPECISIIQPCINK